MPRNDVDVDEGLVRSLLRDQHPDLADRQLEPGPQGWDNQLWRLGDDLAVRLPYATDGADVLLHKEFEWLPTLAERLPLPIPVPQRLGRPSAAFPHPWIVTTWVAGAPADREPPTDPTATAEALAAFLSALHRPAPPSAPVGRGRGGPLAEHDEHVTAALTTAAAQGRIDHADAALALWRDAVVAPAWTGARTWLHGDLHPANVLTAAGTICGVVDFGDLCAGDPALDLAAGWILLPDGAIDRFRDAYRPACSLTDEATWRRARGWAVWRALGCIAVGDAGERGVPGGKRSWGPPARESLRRLAATIT